MCSSTQQQEIFLCLFRAYFNIEKLWSLINLMLALKYLRGLSQPYRSYSSMNSWQLVQVVILGFILGHF